MGNGEGKVRKHNQVHVWLLWLVSTFAQPRVGAMPWTDEMASGQGPTLCFVSAAQIVACRSILRQLTVSILTGIE